MQTEQNKPLPIQRNPFTKPVDVNLFPEGTPERAYLGFAKGWQDRDYEKMLNSCQNSWLIDNIDATIEKLDEAFKDVELICVNYVERIPAEEVRKHGQNPAVVADLKVCVKIKIGKKTKVEVFLPRVLCELGYHEPSPDGQWGVNPVSCFKKRNAK